MFGFVNRVDQVIFPSKRYSSADVPSVSPSSERIQSDLTNILTKKKWAN